jgi:hypothetical protein
MGTSPLPNPQRTPPLGGAYCPDPAWQAGRALVLQGPQAFLGAVWVLTASATGQPASAPPQPVPQPPPAPEGSVPFVDVTAATYTLESAPAEPEGSTAFVDEV